jgi:hypothetical protein
MGFPSSSGKNPDFMGSPRQKQCRKGEMRPGWSIRQQAFLADDPDTDLSKIHQNDHPFFTSITARSNHELTG